jgi:hypothetical protein
MKYAKLQYIMTVKNVCGSVKHIKMTRVNSKKAINYNEYIYSINSDVLSYHIELLKYRCNIRLS